MFINPYRKRNKRCHQVHNQNNLFNSLLKTEIGVDILWWLSFMIMMFLTLDVLQLWHNKMVIYKLPHQGVNNENINNNSVVKWITLWLEPTKIDDESDWDGKIQYITLRILEGLDLFRLSLIQQAYLPVPALSLPTLSTQEHSCLNFTSLMPI